MTPVVLLGASAALLGALLGLAVLVPRWRGRRRAGAVLRVLRARPVSEVDQPVLSRVVRELSSRAGVPVPSLHLSPTPVPNALAVGQGPGPAVLCCTQGLLDRLDESQLRGVVAHEIAHIRAGHTDAGALATLRSVVVRRAAASRRREVEADRAAVRLTGDPMGLAAALRRLEDAATHWQLPPERALLRCAHLMTVDPLPTTTARGRRRTAASHPETASRVARLEQLAGYRR